MTSIAQQDVDELGGPMSVLVRQRRDHEELGRLLDAVQSSTGAEQDEHLRRTWRLVFRHAYAEETVLWPALRKATPDGEDLTLRVEQEHQEINALAQALDGGDPGGPQRPELVTRAVALLRQDVRDEEDLLLPRLQQALDPAALRRLGLAWELVRRTAPTRPHAVVSRRPPGNLLAALPLAVLDHSRDALDAVAQHAGGRAATAASAASRALAGAAGRVEGAPPVQVGERPSTSVAGPR